MYTAQQFHQKFPFLPLVLMIFYFSLDDIKSKALIKVKCINDTKILPKIKKNSEDSIIYLLIKWN